MPKFTHMPVVWILANDKTPMEKAAPDLYAFTEAFLHVGCHCVSGCTLCDQARAALAKARGES